MRQRIGGGMRQAGVIAAPGILALTKMVERLPEDHENAEKLRLGLEALGFCVDRGESSPISSTWTSAPSAGTPPPLRIG